MAGKFTDTDRVTGRRGFFRELLVAAIEGVEKAGHKIAEQRFGHFRQPPSPPPPTPNYERHLTAQYTIYGPPWPPPHGPHVTPALRKQLNAAQAAARASLGEPVPRD